jgi:hypothetical protein
VTIPIIPISDEQAKLGQELVKAVRDASGYFTDILGDIPKDLLGLLVGDRVKAKRIERIEMLWRQTRERLGDRASLIPEPPSLKYAIPILEAAADEENEELEDLGRVCWRLRWTRAGATRCASRSFRRSSRWTRWMHSLSKRSARLAARLGNQIVALG